MSEMSDAKNAKKSIATRWFLNSFGVVALLMLVIDVCVLFLMRTYLYGVVSQSINYEANVVAGVLTRFYDSSGTNYAAEIRNAVEQFDGKSRMELMAIDNNGKVVISSSGFSPEGEYLMPDYDEAMQSELGTAEYVGYLSRNSDDEKYMAVTVRLDADGSDYSAIRVMTSLGKVDSQVMSILFGTVLVSVFVLLLVLLLGLYFVKSIVSPIREIADTARKLAKGDFSERIVARNDDELGELCRVFNYMADELENSETIKNEFISSVSHELRTPLTAIKGWSETMLAMRDEETLVKGMRVITAETERLSEMVEELLDFSRIQNNSLLLQKTNMDILAELADALLIYAERAKKENITLRYLEPDVVAMIYGDKNRLRQVFINIIDNAIKYSSAGGVVTVEAAVLQSEIKIIIRDAGCGIGKAELPKIKTRFYKANNSVRGSGIGLAVADEIVARHDGRLDIESEQGVGTTVTISLPTIQKKADSADEKGHEFER